ncbi:MAG: Rrf2 family transcriptional regulator [Proteobacteria bacterium]|nr:Rrf2 family transcriptional regulator [Pseudomonadota bacterium]
MIITTKARYALQAIVYIAMKETKGPISISEISKNENISNKYLEQLFRRLRMKKLIKSTRGVRGGYVLSKSPSKISVFDIINAVERMDKKIVCPKRKENKAECVTSNLWKHFNDEMIKCLKSYTIEDLLTKGEL